MSVPKQSPARRGGAFLYKASRHIDIVRTLAAHHDIDVTVQLCDEIERAVRNYHHRAARDSSQSSAGERRKRFKALRNHAKGLRETLDQLDVDDLSRLKRRDLPDDQFAQLVEDLRFIEAQAAGTLSELVDTKSRPGRPSHDALHEFIVEARTIYTQATSRSDTFTYLDGVLSGSFVAFLKVMLSCIDVKKMGSDALKAAITKALKSPSQIVN